MDAHKDVYPHALKLGKRIRDLRARKRLTTEDLAKRVGLSQQQVSAIERGKVNTGVETFAAMAEALGTKFEVLMTDEAFEALRAVPPREWHTLAVELAQACLEAPRSRVPLALSLFAAELQGGYALDSEQFGRQHDRAGTPPAGGAGLQGQQGRVAP